MVKSETQLCRWATQVEQEGSHKEKVNETEYTFQTFIRAREFKIIIIINYYRYNYYLYSPILYFWLLYNYVKSRRN